MQSVEKWSGLFVGLAMTCLYVSPVVAQTDDQAKTQTQAQTQTIADSQSEPTVSSKPKQPVIPRVKYNGAPDWENFRRLQQEGAPIESNSSATSEAYFSEEKRAREREYQQRLLNRKQYWEDYNQAYNGGLGVGVGYLERYDYYNSKQPYKGLVLSGYVLGENAAHKLEFSWLASELEVLGPGNPQPATRHWDLLYTVEDFETFSQLAFTRYFSPAVGLRLKENLTVTCKNKRSHCFYSTYEDWDIESRHEEVLPLFGFVTGFVVYNRYLHADISFNALGDSDSIYLGWSLSVGGVYAHSK